MVMQLCRAKRAKIIFITACAQLRHRTKKLWTYWSFCDKLFQSRCENYLHMAGEGLNLHPIEFRPVWVWIQQAVRKIQQFFHVEVWPLRQAVIVLRPQWRIKFEPLRWIMILPVQLYISAWIATYSLLNAKFSVWSFDSFVYPLVTVFIGRCFSTYVYLWFVWKFPYSESHKPFMYFKTK